MNKKIHKHGFYKGFHAYVREIEIRCGVRGHNNLRKMHRKPLDRHYSIVKNRERIRKNEQS